MVKHGGRGERDVSEKQSVYVFALTNVVPGYGCLTARRKITG